MKNIIKLSFFVVFILSSFDGSAQFNKRKKSKKDTHNFRYEIECNDTGARGTVAIKVFSYSKKPDIAIEAAKRNAVHGIIFKGFPRAGKCQKKDPLARNPNLEQEYEEFFKEFFKDGGKYLKFVNASTDGAIEGGDISKISKREYKIGINVSVNRSALEKDLISAKIIEGLGSRF
jgi:hypothetical protein|tara:strand:+ start:491 stop:1015 length:525 start_codon:yes stop_codon:yes gene_type:complete